MNLVEGFGDNDDLNMGASVDVANINLSTSHDSSAMSGEKKKRGGEGMRKR